MKLGRRLGLAAAIVFGTPALVLLLAFALAQTGPGKRLIADMAGTLASSPTQQIRIEGLSGTLPFDLSIGRVEVSDAGGVWLAAEEIVLNWSPLALLAARLDIASLRAASVEIARPPADDGQPRVAGEGSSLSLPVRVNVERLEIERLTLGAALAGEAASWRVQAGARAMGTTGINTLKVAAARSDGGTGTLDLAALYDGAQETVQIKLLAREQGSALRNLFDIDVGRDVELRADISGPLRALNGNFEIDAGDTLSATGVVRTRDEDAGTQTSLSIAGRAGRLADAPWADTVAGEWSLQAEARIDAATVVIESARLVAPSGSASASGRIERTDASADLEFFLEIAGDRLARLAPGTRWRQLAASGRLDGRLAQPRIAATISGADIGIGDAEIGQIAIDLSASAEPAGSFRFELAGSLDGIVLPLADDRRVSTNATLALKGTGTEEGRIDIAEFAIRSPLIEAAGSLRLDPQRTLPSGTLRLKADDLAAFAEAAGIEIGGALDLTLNAAPAGDGTALRLEATLDDGKIADVPAVLLGPRLGASLRAVVGPDWRWRVDELHLASLAGEVSATGEGSGASGRASLRYRLENIAALGDDQEHRISGSLSGTAEIEGSPDDMKATLRAVASGVRVQAVVVSRLSLDLDVGRRDGTTAGVFGIDGEMQGAPLRGSGGFSLADDRTLHLTALELGWASLSIDAAELTVSESGSSGEAVVRMVRLEELNALTGLALGGSLAATLRASAADRLEFSATLRDFRLDDAIALETARLDGEIGDPFGRAIVKATGEARGSPIAGPLQRLSIRIDGERADIGFSIEAEGERLRIASQGRVGATDAETAIELRTLGLDYGGQNAALGAPARIVMSGPTTTIETLTLRAGDGTLSIAGTLHPSASRLDAVGRGLPLSLLQALAPEATMTGTANFGLELRGAQARPDIELSLEASDMRVRAVRTAGIPPGALTLKAALRAGTATIDGRFSAGSDNAVTFSGTGPLPGPDGISDGRLKIDAALRLAQLTPFLGGAGRLDGNLTADLTFVATGGAIAGDGSVRIAGGRYLNSPQGIAFRDIEAEIGVSGDRLEIRRFSARSRGTGEVSASGGVRVDQALTLPIDVSITARSARVLDRRDIRATLSSDLRLSGSVFGGMSLAGTATVERAELDLDAEDRGGPRITEIDVREINRPDGAPDDEARQPAAGPVPQMALAIRVDAPRAVFVRGRGLDVEMGGTLEIAGTLGQPRILGALQLRRGTFSGIGRRLDFTRGSITFPDPDRLEPRIDFAASTRIETGSVEIAIAGRPAAPTIALSSAPPLPQDEIMAQLLFGRSTRTLSPLQMAEIGQSIGSLTGLTGSGGSFLDRMRRALGFDRLAVSSDPNAQTNGSPLAGSSVELGRYVAPGVYIGARQGAEAGSTTAVVEIEISPNVKVESEIGGDSGSRIGVSIEWDY